MAIKHLLIDADIFAYKASSASQRGYRWDDGYWTLIADENEAFNIIDQLIDSTIRKVGGEGEAVICISDDNNFRTTVSEQYKSNRADVMPPLTLKACKEYMKEKYKAVVYPNLEADDVMAILATHPVHGKNCVIVSQDKDLTQVEGVKVYRPDSKERVVGTNKFFFEQVLTGDPVDGYKGCPGVGKIKCDKLIGELEDPKEIWDVIVKAFEKHGGEEEAIKQAQMAWMLRHDDYNKETGEYTLWRPETHLHKM
tara:strand:- start:11195 stop:11953 length:759 start_codon:yes stop_codon:yes gene_type:complete